jgi:hypothetical protein
MQTEDQQTINADIKTQNTGVWRQEAPQVLVSDGEISGSHGGGVDDDW